MSNNVSIEIDSQCLHFSVAHFTIFSASHRERLHGHNYQLGVQVEAAVGDDGLAFNYCELKRALQSLCQGLDEYTLLPSRSPHLNVCVQGEYYAARFADQTLLLLQSDTLLLPLRNISLEELGQYFIDQLLADDLCQRLGISALVLSVASGPGQRISRRVSIK